MVVILCCIDMVNRPEYVNIWLGMAKIGGRSALINYNLKMKGLVHSLEVSQSKMLIFGYEVRDNIEAVLPDLKRLGLKLFVQGIVS
jgi:long-subunit acyl-CoA synthetase (AMP-forming)